MELWIRSQNKGALIKVEMLGNTDGTIKSYLGVNQTVLGTYKSNKRALEILDEIQKILNPKGIIKFKSLLAKEDIKRIQDSFDGEFIVGDASSEIIKLGDTYVYEMPKK